MSDEKITAALNKLARSREFAAILSSNPNDSAEVKAQKAQLKADLVEVVKKITAAPANQPYKEPGVIWKSLETAYESGKGALGNAAAVFVGTTAVKAALNKWAPELSGARPSAATAAIAVASAERTATLEALRTGSGFNDEQKRIIHDATHDSAGTGAPLTGEALTRAYEGLLTNGHLQGALAEPRRRANEEATAALGYTENNPVKSGMKDATHFAIFSFGIGGLIGTTSAWSRVKEKYAVHKKVHELLNRQERPVARGGAAQGHGAGDADDIMLPNVPLARGRRQQQSQLANTQI